MSDIFEMQKTAELFRGISGEAIKSPYWKPPLPSDEQKKIIAAMTYLDPDKDPEEERYKLSNAMFLSSVYGLDFGTALGNYDLLIGDWQGKGKSHKSAWQAIKDEVKVGTLNSEMGKLGMELMLKPGGKDEAIEARIDEIWEEMGTLADTLPRNKLVEIAKLGANTLPFSLDVMTSGMKAALVAGAGIAAGGAILASGGTAALPLVPAASGISAAGTATLLAEGGAMQLGSFTQSMKISGGLAYIKWRKDGMSHDVAAPLAATFGGISAALEVWLGDSVRAIGKVVTPGKVSKVSQHIMAKLALSGRFAPLITSAVDTFLIGPGGELLDESSQELAEFMVPLIAEQIARFFGEEGIADDIAQVNKETVRNIAWQVYDAGVGGFLGSLALAPLFSGPGIITSVSDAVSMKQYVESLPAMTAIYNIEQLRSFQAIQDADLRRDTAKQYYMSMVEKTKRQITRDYEKRVGVKADKAGVPVAETLTSEQISQEMNELKAKFADETVTPTEAEIDRMSYLSYLQEIEEVEQIGRRAKESADINFPVGENVELSIWEESRTEQRAKSSAELKEFLRAEVKGLETEQDLDSATYALDRMVAKIPGLTMDRFIREAFVDTFTSEDLRTEVQEAGAVGGVKRIGDQLAVAFSRDANGSTVMHESAHLYLEYLKMFRHVEEIGAELARIEKAFGVTEGNWTAEAQAWSEQYVGDRSFNEFFTQSLEDYIQDRATATQEQETVFSKILEWIKEIYQAIFQRTEMTEDVRQYFDDLFGLEPLSDVEIEQAVGQQATTETMAAQKVYEETTVPDSSEVVEVPLADIKPHPGLPQFKEGADASGVVEPLKGQKYIRTGTAGIVLWQSLDGELYLVTGRHRLDLARRTGETTIPSHILKESDGFILEDMITLDAESNIRDEHGSTRDFANYFRRSDYSVQEASSRGLLSRDTGRKGYAIGQYAEANLYSLYRNSQITAEKAAAIAEAAPNNAALQDAGIKKSKELNASELGYYVEALRSMVPASELTQLDMFGADDTMIIEAEKMAKAAVSKLQGFKDEQTAFRSALRLTAAERSKYLSQYGFKSGDTDAIQARLMELNAEVERWQNWTQDADLVREVRREAGLSVNEAQVEGLTTQAEDASQSLLFQMSDITDEGIGERSYTQKDYQSERLFPGTEKGSEKAPLGSIVFEEQGNKGFNEVRQALSAEAEYLGNLTGKKAPKEGSILEYTRKLYEGVEALREGVSKDESFKGDLELVRQVQEGEKSGGERFLTLKEGKYSLDFGLGTYLPESRIFSVAKGDIEAARRSVISALYPVEVGEAIAAFIRATPEVTSLKVNGDISFDWQSKLINTIVENSDRSILVQSRSHAPGHQGGGLSQISSGWYNPANPKTGSAVYKTGIIDSQTVRQYGVEFLKDNLSERGIINSFVIADPSDARLARRLVDSGVFLVLQAENRAEILQAIEQEGLTSSLILPFTLEQGLSDLSFLGTQIAMTPEGNLYLYSALAAGQAVEESLRAMSDIGISRETIEDTVKAFEATGDDVISESWNEFSKNTKSLEHVEKNLDGSKEGPLMSRARDHVFHSASQVYPVTQDASRAGYILPDGRMLDLTGRSASEVTWTGAPKDLTQRVQRFIEMGAIALGEDHVSVGGYITSAQMKAMSEYLTGKEAVTVTAYDQGRITETILQANAETVRSFYQNFVTGEEMAGMRAEGVAMASQVRDQVIQGRWVSDESLRQYQNLDWTIDEIEQRNALRELASEYDSSQSFVMDHINLFGEVTPEGYNYLENIWSTKEEARMLPTSVESDRRFMANLDKKGMELFLASAIDGDVQTALQRFGSETFIEAMREVATKQELSEELYSKLMERVRNNVSEFRQAVDALTHGQEEYQAFLQEILKERTDERLSEWKKRHEALLAEKDLSLEKISREAEALRENVAKADERVTALDEALKSAKKEAGLAARTLKADLRKEAIAAKREAVAKTKELFKKKAAIQKLITQILKQPSQGMYWVHQEQLSNLQAGYTLGKSKKQTELIQTLKDTYERTGDAKIKARLDTLQGAVDLKKMTVDELQALALEVQGIRQEGLLMRKLKLLDNRIEFNNDKQTILETMKPLMKEKIRGRMSKEGREAAKTSFWKKLQLAGFTPERVAEVLQGGSDGYWSYLLEVLPNETTDSRVRRQLSRSDAVFQSALDLDIDIGSLGKYVTQDGITYTKQDVIGFYIQMQNEKSRLALLGGDNISEETVNAFIDTLSADEKMFAENLMEIVGGDEIHALLKMGIGETKNRVLGYQDKYFTMLRRDISGLNKTAQEMETDLLESKGLRRGGVRRGWDIDRKQIALERQTPIRHDAFNIALEQIQAQELFLARQELLNRLNKIANDRDIQEALVLAHGNEAIHWLRKMIVDLGSPDVTMDVASKAQRYLMHYSALAYLSFNPVTMLKQLPSVLYYLGDASPVQIMKAAGWFFKNPKEAIDFVREMDPQMMARNIDQVQAAMKNVNAQGYEAFIKKVGEKGMAGIYLMDTVAVTIGWKAVYDTEMAKHGDHELAKRKAQSATSRTQPSVREHNLPQLYRSGQFAWFLRFTNQLNKMFNMVAWDIPLAVREQNYHKAIGYSVGIIMSGLAMGLITRKRLPEDWKEGVGDVFTQVFNTIPLFGDEIATTLQGWERTGGTPIGDIVRQGKRTVEAVANDGASTEKKILEAAKLITEGMVFTGLPSTFTKRTIKMLYDEVDGWQFDPWEIIGGPPVPRSDRR